MRREKRECPGCSSMQSFPVRNRRIDSTRIEVFIACSVCPWNQVIRISTAEIEKLRERERKLGAESRSQMARRGCISASLDLHLNEVIQRRVRLEHEMRTDNAY